MHTHEQLLDKRPSKLPLKRLAMSEPHCRMFLVVSLSIESMELPEDTEGGGPPPGSDATKDAASMSAAPPHATGPMASSDAFRATAAKPVANRGVVA
mmetsp:Transcript_14453/g.31316  ORF Transcript_14453/g.31316 Transcript_14453/m.31316 type:complete len:97 (+) Transcript_14453:1524-1814(+)